MPSAPKPKLSVVGEEIFSSQSPYERSINFSASLACEAAHQLLLGQGYSITQATSGSVVAAKAFQPNHDNHIKLDIVVTCMPKEERAILYTVAKQTFFEIKASSDTRELSLAGMSISLPVSSGSDSLVKIGEETISDSTFYSNFFDLLETKFNLKQE